MGLFCKNGKFLFWKFLYLKHTFENVSVLTKVFSFPLIAVGFGPLYVFEDIWRAHSACL